MGSRDDQSPPAPEGILSAVAYAAREFLRASDWRDTVGRVLQRLGEAAAASRAYVFENRVVDGVLTETQLFEWAAPGIRPTVDDADSFEEPYPPQVERWVRILSGGGAIAGPTKDFPPDERDFIEGLGQEILSCAFVPMFVDGRWWGYLGFDDCETEREWTSDEIDALRTAAEVLGAAIERRALDERLREAEERHLDLIEQVPAILYTDLPLEGETTYVSPQIETILGVTVRDWLDDPDDLWNRMLHPEDRDRVLAQFGEFLAGSRRDLDDYRMVRPDGRVLWIRDRGRLERDAESGAVVEHGVLLDITEVKEAESRVLEAEEKFRSLVVSIPAVTYIDAVEGLGHTQYISPQLEEMLGYTPEEWMADPDNWLRQVHPEDRDRELELIERVARTGESYETEYRIVARDGRTVWVHEASVLVRDAKGDPIHWQGVLIDMTVRKEAERKARETEERFRVLVEGGTSIVYMDDPGEAGDTIYISPQIEDLLGCTQEEFLAAQDLWVKALHPDDRERIMALEESSHLSWESYEAEYRVINSRGETTWLHEQARLVNNDDGSPLFWLGVILDITKQKVAEDRQREAERDLALEQATSARLRELDRAKDALLTAVSHDFRAPLSNILGFAATLEESSQALSPDRTKDFVHRIAANGWRLERLVADIMEVSRLKEDPADIERMTTDLAGLVERVVEQSSLGEKYPVMVASEPIVISVDLPKLERLVQNLITNAVVHNPDGVAVRVRVGPVPGGAQISVEDNGKGVPEDVIAGLFEEFTVDEETMHRGAAPGLGLGLSIVKRFAELHGGRVWHEEPEGGGAAFHVFLPGETAEVESAR